MQLKKLISNTINDILSIVEHLPGIDYDFIISQSENDLKAFAQKDPSSNKGEIYILKSYLTYFVTMSYRVANYLHLKNEKINARKISENAKNNFV
ncbi:hypothetical protein [Campylobacter fetus]|uniref:hypothetical protein n=1 Tax=Campylobacter fetus TaxID=196 RepID=UPI000818AAC6|nr:hypothetical protein [Campylobacter fetus]OCR84851.1 hypothetical protein CFT12S05168_07840 [Campylobacter fetus subsp. testudinum]